MPKYHYRCEKCENEFDEIQRITDDPLKICPNCKEKVYRVISSNVGVSFKGGGFHVNDYHGKNNLTSKTPSSEKKDSKEVGVDSKKKDTKKKDIEK